MAGIKQLRKCISAVKKASKAAHVRTPYQSCIAGKLKGQRPGNAATARKNFADAARACKGK